MSNKLIVYYSYTNHTKQIAEDIQKQLQCDIIELKPVKPYSTDYNTVVGQEQNNESTKKTPEIENKNLDLSKYDEIILGTPVWWYTIAPVVRTFLKENDLSDKNIALLYGDETYLKMTNQFILEGEYPNKENEIAMSKY